MERYSRDSGTGRQTTFSDIGLAIFTLVFFLFGCTPARDARKNTQELQPLPAGYALGLVADSAVIPRENPMTAGKARLGERLFFDKQLSVDGSVSCATCHAPEKGFSDSQQFSLGVGGRRGTRHAPTIINRVFSAAQFWDGRASSLEEQILGPVQNPIEMAMPDMQVVVDRLRKDASYAAEFSEAFPSGDGMTAQNVVRAIAVFERTILSGNSPYDRFIAGDPSALSDGARQGMEIFMDESRGNCRTCHAGPNFTDENYNNIGVGMTARKPDMGRYNVTRLEGHRGAFKTPTLRDVARRGPYMHDGSQKSLEEVVDFYDKGGHRNKWLSPKIKPLHLSPEEKRDLVKFLKALSGELTWYGRAGKH